MYLFRFLALPPDTGKSLDQILQINSIILESDIIENIITMREKEGLSFSSTNLFLASIYHFFSINDVILNRKKISKFIGEHQTKHEYRSYTADEISRLLSLQDERGTVIVLLMASTGMRVGAIPDLKLKHLKKMTIGGEHTETYVYKITVYANLPKSKYITFCTPECATAIDVYLEMRQRHGESSLKRDKNGNWIPNDTPLIVRQFDKTRPHFIYHTKSIGPVTISKKIVVSKLLQLGIRNKVYSSESMSKSQSAKVRHNLHPCHSLRIFAVTQMQRSKLDKTIREMLIGYSTGLDKAYYKPQDEEILEEYQKAIEALTISNEERLKKQIFKYKQKSEGLQEMSQQLNERCDQKFQLLKDEWETKFQLIYSKISAEKLDAQ
jgi:integrase